MRKNPVSIVFVNLFLFLGLCFIWVGVDYFADWQVTINGFDRVCYFLLTVIFTVGTFFDIKNAVNNHRETAKAKESTFGK